MNLKIINTGSAGNCYILTDSNNKSLIIECGVKIEEIKKALDFDVSNIEACIISHYHMDHSLCINNLLAIGIDVFAPSETFLKRSNSTDITTVNMNPILSGSNNRAGSFQFIPFNLYHDCEIFGYFIYHPESGPIVFATDTSKVPYQFQNVRTFIIEANYCEEILTAKEVKGEKNYVTSRVEKTHLSIQKCVEFLLNNNLSQTDNIILIHLSDSNSDEARFKSIIEKSLGKPAIVANAGMEINLNLF
jgi:phosphoribosyl 1,2-cyclic phosphodiesterase